MLLANEIVENKRSTILTVSGGGANKTIDITQKALSLGRIEIAGCIYSTNGTLLSVMGSGMTADIRAVMSNPPMGIFVFPMPIQTLERCEANHNALLRIKVNDEIPSRYKGEKVVAFLENMTGDPIYTPKKELTADVYRDLDKSVFDLDLAGGINTPNTELIDISFALNNRQNIAILLTNHDKIEFTNLVWKSILYVS